MRAQGIRFGLAAVGVGMLLVAGCGSGGSEEATTTTKAATTSTEADDATTTTTDATTTTAAGDPTTTTKAGEPTTTVDSHGLEPGDPCSLEEGVPDCIDPDGDGQGEYLIGGADCIANSPGPGACADLDGDGKAGYPDAG